MDQPAEPHRNSSAMRTAILPCGYRGEGLLQSLLWRLQSSTVNADLREQRRRPSISSDGSPVVLSCKVSRDDQQPVVKTLFEPGGLYLNIAEQIDYTAKLFDELCSDLGAAFECDRIHALIQLILPSNPADRESLWGGLWIGVEHHTVFPALRLYINLRHGSPESRWKRFLNVADSFGMRSAEPLDDSEVDSPLAAAPTGLCVAVEASGIAGIRLYTTLPAPDREQVAAWLARVVPNARESAEQMTQSFVDQFGPLDRQSVSLSYDFAVTSERMNPIPQRRKLELSCQAISQRSRIMPWFSTWCRQSGFGWGARLQSAVSELAIEHGPLDPQYLSVGFEDRIEHFTIYLQPTDRCANHSRGNFNG